jgi:RNA polymerase sigma factor (TIGR02999 family)
MLPRVLRKLIAPAWWFRGQLLLMDGPACLTTLIHRAEKGDVEAANQLFAAMYDELRRLARAQLRGRRRNTVLETSSLVHESYLRFARAQQLRLQDRVHFMRWAGSVMRSVIVDIVRRRLAYRRGGGMASVALTTGVAASVPSGETEILRVHEALDDIAVHDARMAKIVEMRYFAGMTEVEIAEAIGVNERTVRRDWEKARLFLREALQQRSLSAEPQ